MKTRWRIVTDNYAGYEVQAKDWWWPFWREFGFCNTHLSVEDARLFIERQQRKRRPKKFVEEYLPSEHPNP